MKNLISKTIFIGLMFLTATSCALHSGYATNSASLGQNNFDYILKDISGSSSATYIFAIGGLAKNNLVSDAKNKMLAASPLKSNQALANLTVNWKQTNFGIYVSLKCTVTADVVEFR